MSLSNSMNWVRFVTLFLTWKSKSYYEWTWVCSLYVEPVSFVYRSLTSRLPRTCSPRELMMRWQSGTDVPVEPTCCLSKTWSSRDLSLGLETSRDSFFQVLVLVLVPLILGLGLERPSLGLGLGLETCESWVFVSRLHEKTHAVGFWVYVHCWSWLITRIVEPHNLAIWYIW